MFFFKKVIIFICAIQLCDKVKCMPRYRVKSVEKRFHFAVTPLPVKHIRFTVEKLPPLERYGLKHAMHKRQIAESDVSPASNEIPVVAIEEVVKPEEDKHLTPEVLITSIIKPVEDGKSFSFMLPVESELIIIPAEKGSEIIKQSSNEVSINSESILKTEEVVSHPDQVVEITPKPIELPPPLEPKPIVQDVVINTPIESTVPSISQVSLVQNTNDPISSSVVQNIPEKTLLYTDIVSQIPVSGVQYPGPAVIPEVIVPPPPPPPIKEPPVIKEETPNFLIKGSRLVLYFGSVMLQMLSKLVNGGINLNQPLHPVLPDIP